MEEINQVGYLTGIKVKQLRTLLVESKVDIFHVFVYHYTSGRFYFRISEENVLIESLLANRTRI